MERLHGEIYAGYRAGLEALLSECGMAASEVRLAAVGITALVDGLWLELCLAPGTFSAEEASGIAEKWIGGLLP
ncbi:HTH-type transcriptional regulator BetI [compost metagenome]